jgi:glycosyltransferase involved in cell wall biosynthesis
LAWGMCCENSSDILACARHEMKGRILFIDHDDGRSGATVSLEYLVDAFIDNGYQVFILTPKRGKSAKTYRESGASLLDFGTDRFDVLRLSTHAATSVSFTSIKGLRWLVNNVTKFILGYVVVARAIRQVRPDLVYVNEHVIVQSSLAACVHRVPSVIHIRSRMISSGRGIPRYVLSRLILMCNKKVFAITALEAEQLCPKKREAQKIRVVGEFAPHVERVSSMERKARLRFGIPTSKKVVTLLGGMWTIKGTLDFLQAALRVSSERKDVVFVIAGPTMKDTSPEELAYYEDCIRIIRFFPKKSDILVLGELGDSTKLISCSDIVVSPSTISHFSRPVIEAWAFSKAVIASHSDHMDALVKEGKDGMLFSSRNVTELTNCVNILLDDRTLRKQLGKAGKARVESEFSAIKNTQVIIDECSKLISAKM